MKSKKEYVLGTGQDELERLALQHRIWADASVAAWKRANIGPGTRVLDVGSGPGYASFDLAQLVTRTGAVAALDESEEFTEFVRLQAELRGLPQLKTFMGDAQNVDATLAQDGAFDVAYTRWVLCWLADPLSALTSVRRVLKPEGRFVIHDYFNWKAMSLAPRSSAVDKMIAAAVDSFVEKKGDVDIAARLPALLRKAGFKILHFEVHQRVARGGGLDSTAAWPVSWWRTYGPKLVKAGKLSAIDLKEAEHDLDTFERDPDQFFFCPPLFEFIATPA